MDKRSRQIKLLLFVANWTSSESGKLCDYGSGVLFTYSRHLRLPSARVTVGTVKVDWGHLFAMAELSNRGRNLWIGVWNQLWHLPRCEWCHTSRNLLLSVFFCVTTKIYINNVISFFCWQIPTYRTKPPPKEIFDTLKLVSDQPEFDRQDPSVLNKLENCIPGKERRSRTSEDSGLPSSPCQSGFDFPSHQNGFVFETSGKKQEEVTCTYTGLPYEDAEMQVQESGTNALLIGNVAPSFEDARNEGECLENRLNDSAVNSHRYARPISSRLIDHQEGYVPMARHDRTLSIEGSSMSESRVDTESSEGVQSYTCMSSYAKSGNEHEQVAWSWRNKKDGGTMKKYSKYVNHPDSLNCLILLHNFDTEINKFYSCVWVVHLVPMMKYDNKSGSQDGFIIMHICIITIMACI